MLAVMYDLPEMTHSRYGGVMRAINFDRRRPPELTFHAAWAKEDGSGWQIFEVWESPQAWEAFFTQRYNDAMRGRGQKFSFDILSVGVNQIYTGN